MLGSASASLHAFWPAVMRQYSINLQDADPAFFASRPTRHDDAIRGLGDAYAICDLWSVAQGDLRGMKEAVAICDVSSVRRVSTSN